MHLRNSRRGQITIFVIIGLILIIGIALYFYLMNRTTEQVVNIPRLTGDFGEVQSFTEGCIEQVAKEGIAELGLHGGYIDPLNDTYTSTMFQSSIDYNTFDQSESDMAFLDWRDKTTGVPYWYHARSTDTGSGKCWHCSVDTLTPTISSMQEQLGIYVDSNLGSCLDDYDTFKEQGFDIVSVTNSTTIATITDSKVDFYTNYTVQITRNGETKYLEAFYKEVDTPLMQYYLIAVNITQNEIDTEYLDFYGLYLLGQYSGVDSKKLPPISAYRIGYDPVFWSKMNTKRLYETQLGSYTQFFRIKGSGNDNIAPEVLNAGTIESNMYNAMNLAMFDTKSINALDIKNKDITYTYTGTPIYLNIDPSNGDLVSPLVTQDTSSFSKSLSNINPDQSYEFYYDISYPVLVEISDPRVGHEYTFRIALQANIKDNRILSDWLKGYGTIPWDNSYVKVYNNIPAGTVLVDEDTGDEYIYNNTMPSKTYFCDDTQKVSANIRLRTYDSMTERPVSGVKVAYNCGTYSRCNEGFTKYNTTTLDSSFYGKMPLCTNGYISLEKDGYLGKRIALSTEYGKGSNLGSIYLEPIIDKNATVKKYNVTNDGINIMQVSINKFDINDSENLSDTDSVVVTMTKKTFDEFDEPWSQTVIFGRDGENTSTISLVPGAYTIDAQLLDYNGIKVPKECKEICVDKNFVNAVFGGCNKWQKIPDSDIVIDVAMWGGVEYDENNTFTVTSEDLQSNNTLEFHVIRMPDPRCIDDLQYPSEISTLSKKYRTELKPAFK